MTTSPKIVFFDIDDTLYIKHEDRIPDSVLPALLALKRQNIHIGIATGRGKSIFPPCINRLIDEVGIDIFVTINGQYNEHQGRLLSHFPLTLTQIQNTTNLLKDQHIAYGYMTSHEIIGFDQDEQMIHALTSLHIPYRLAQDFDLNTPIYQILAFFDNSQNSHLSDRLDGGLKTVRWHTTGVDILDKRGSKARGIADVLDKLGLSMSEAVAFGDGLNDVEMLSSVGVGVAMGNGHDTLKNMAHFICPRHDDDGIYQGLKMLGVI